MTLILKAKTPHLKSETLMGFKEFRLKTCLQMLEQEFEKNFHNTSGFLNYSPVDFFKDLWNQENEMESVEQDYPAFKEFYNLSDFTSNKIVHLLFIPGKIDQENLFFNSLQTLKQIGCQKIVLHLVLKSEYQSDLKNFIFKLNSFSKEHSPVDDFICLGTVQSEKYFLSKDPMDYCTGLRAILDPEISGENIEFETLDQYFYLKYGIKYFLNREEYTAEIYPILESKKGLLEKLYTVLTFFKGNLIFPVISGKNYISKNQQLWLVNSEKDFASNFVYELLKMNKVFNFNLMILTNGYYTEKFFSSQRLDHLSRLQYSTSLYPVIFWPCLNPIFKEAVPPDSDSQNADSLKEKLLYPSFESEQTTKFKDGFFVLDVSELIDFDNQKELGSGLDVLIKDLEKKYDQMVIFSNVESLWANFDEETLLKGFCQFIYLHYRPFHAILSERLNSLRPPREIPSFFLPDF